MATNRLAVGGRRADSSVPKRRGVIIAGMHRSGTSALTRVLGYCGLRLPGTLVPADEGNIAGHWESEDVFRFNDKLLARCGLDWISWRAPVVDLASEHDYPDLVSEGARIILKEFGGRAHFVLKDPRICRLLRFWLDVFVELEIEPLLVLALRAPEQVALSLGRRNAILARYAYLAWLRFTLEAERASRHLPRMVVDFDQLMQDPHRVVTSIGGFAQDYCAWTPEAESAVAAFLSSDLRHFGQDDHRASAPASVALTYSLLSQWKERDETRADYVQLDGVRRKLDEAPAMLIRYDVPGWMRKWLRRQRQRIGGSLLVGDRVEPEFANEVPSPQPS